MLLAGLDSLGQRPLKLLARHQRAAALLRAGPGLVVAQDQLVASTWTAFTGAAARLKAAINTGVFMGAFQELSGSTPDGR